MMHLKQILFASAKQRRSGLPIHMDHRSTVKNPLRRALPQRVRLSHCGRTNYRKGGCIMQEKKIIELKDIAVSFDGEPVLKNLNLSISDGEFVTLLGPSGCGKTTTLRIIAGFVTPDTGDVFFEGKRVNDLPAYRRPVNTIFQRYALFPHLNVYENVAFGMRVQ